MSDNETADLRKVAQQAADRGSLLHLNPTTVLNLIHELDDLRTAVIDHINQRPEYIQALRNTRGDGNQADYYRWSGHAEARRQLAQKLNLARVPHEFSERLPVTTTNEPEVPR